MSKEYKYKKQPNRRQYYDPKRRERELTSTELIDKILNTPDTSEGKYGSKHYTPVELSMEIEDFNISYSDMIIDDVRELTLLLSTTALASIKEWVDYKGTSVKMVYNSVADAILQNSNENTSYQELAELEIKYTQLKFQQNPVLYEYLARTPYKTLDEFHRRLKTLNFTNYQKDKIIETCGGKEPLTDTQTLDTVKVIRYETKHLFIDNIDVHDHEHTIKNLIEKNKLMNKIPPQWSQDDFNKLLIRTYAINMRGNYNEKIALDLLQTDTSSMSTKDVLTKLKVDTYQDNYDLTKNILAFNADGVLTSHTNNNSNISPGELIAQTFKIANKIHKNKLVMILPTDDNYPELLKSSQSPLPIFVKGNLNNLNNPKFGRMLNYDQKLKVNQPVAPIPNNLYVENKFNDLGFSMVLPNREYNQTNRYLDNTIWLQGFIFGEDRTNINLNRDTVIQTTFEEDARLNTKDHLLRIEQQFQIDLSDMISIPERSLLHSEKLRSKKGLTIFEINNIEPIEVTATQMKNKLLIYHNKKSTSTPALDSYVNSYKEDVTKDQKLLYHYINPSDPFDLNANKDGLSTKQTDISIIKEKISNYYSSDAYKLIEMMDKGFVVLPKNVVYDPNYPKAPAYTEDYEKYIAEKQGHTQPSSSENNPIESTIKQNLIETNKPKNNITNIENIVNNFKASNKLSISLVGDINPLHVDLDNQHVKNALESRGEDLELLEANVSTDDLKLYKKCLAIDEMIKNLSINDEYRQQLVELTLQQQNQIENKDNPDITKPIIKTELQPKNNPDLTDLNI